MAAMAGIAVFTGAESIKGVVVGRGYTAETINTKAIPFVGTDGDGEFAQMGVGVTFPELEKAYLWGLVLPHNLVQSWRGMKILEKTSIIDPNKTLVACWYAAALGALEKSYAGYLSESGISYLELQIMRALVQRQQPDKSQLANAITKLGDAGVRVDDY